MTADETTGGGASAAAAGGESEADQGPSAEELRAKARVLASPQVGVPTAQSGVGSTVEAEATVTNSSRASRTFLGTGSRAAAR